MCSDNCGATERANDVCEECGQPTVDGYTKNVVRIPHGSVNIVIGPLVMEVVDE